MLKETQRVEGEGLMLRKPQSLYKRTRSTGEFEDDCEEEGGRV